MHAKSAPHGLVTDAIPYDKLQEFLKAEEAARKRAAKGEGVRAGAKPRADRRKRHWYARYLLWAEAEKLDTEQRQAECGPMHSIDDLGDAEFTECLERVNEYIRLHVPLQHRTGTTSVGFIERDQGPRTVAERHEKSAAYNGRDGGRVFKWYTRPAFERHLWKVGWQGKRKAVETCTEKQCMQALRATSAELQMFPLERNRLKPYAGPQCFPQLQDPARRFANEEEPGTTAEVGADAARKQLTECWLQCDKCKKWRVVERASLPALKPEEYSKRREGCVEVDWGKWLGESQG